MRIMASDFDLVHDKVFKISDCESVSWRSVRVQFGAMRCPFVAYLAINHDRFPSRFDVVPVRP